MKNFELITSDNNGVEVHHFKGDLKDGRPHEGHVYHVNHGETTSTLNFQLGQVNENGVNGLTNEALLTVLIHRMGVLNTAFPCVENVHVIGNLISALEQLNLRTKDRIERGVEGESKV